MVIISEWSLMIIIKNWKSSHWNFSWTDSEHRWRSWAEVSLWHRRGGAREFGGGLHFSHPLLYVSMQDLFEVLQHEFGIFDCLPLLSFVLSNKGWFRLFTFFLGHWLRWFYWFFRFFGGCRGGQVAGPLNFNWLFPLRGLALRSAVLLQKWFVI